MNEVMSLGLELLPGHCLLYVLFLLYEMALEFDDHSTSLDVVRHLRCWLWHFEIMVFGILEWMAMNVPARLPVSVPSIKKTFIDLFQTKKYT